VPSRISDDRVNRLDFLCEKRGVHSVVGTLPQRSEFLAQAHEFASNRRDIARLDCVIDFKDQGRIGAGSGQLGGRSRIGSVGNLVLFVQHKSLHVWEPLIWPKPD